MHLKLIAKLFADECNILAYARNRHSSLVLERLLEAMTGEFRRELQEERDALMIALLGDDTSNPPFTQMALDRFGSSEYSSISSAFLSFVSKQFGTNERLAAITPTAERSRRMSALVPFNLSVKVVGGSRGTCYATNKLPQETTSHRGPLKTATAGSNKEFSTC